jgi:hypothetical protein
MGFQTAVNLQPAPGIAGDFASANVRMSVVPPGGQGALVAGPGGVTVGRFAWFDTATGSKVTNHGSGVPNGFMARPDALAVITTWLNETTMLVPQGLGVTLYSDGDFWVVNSGTNMVIPNLRAYANNANGLVSFGVTGSPPTGASVTADVAASTGSFTGSIVDNLLTITAVGSGVAVVGGTLSGTNVVSGTMITDQLTGTAGGVGTYRVNIPGQAATSTTISETYGTMTVASVGSGALAVGDAISGTNVVAGTYISALGTGTGGTGTYIVSNNAVVGSTTITVAGGTETKWRSAGFAAPGELVRMTSYSQG